MALPCCGIFFVLFIHNWQNRIVSLVRCGILSVGCMSVSGECEPGDSNGVPGDCAIRNLVVQEYELE